MLRGKPRDNHRVLRHHRRGLHADFAGNRIRENVLIIISFKSTSPLFPNEGIPNARLRIQANEAETLRHIQISLFFAVGPIASPRPESCRGAAPPRFPSCSPWIQSPSPVAGSAQ